MAGDSSPFAGVILLMAAFAIYFLPTFVAAKRGHPNGTSIFLLDLFLGWSLIGWVVALVWSASAFKVDEQPSLSEISPTEEDRLQNLQKLAALKDSGHLTAEEFESEKAKLLKG